jgi:hypothetical protein
VRRTIRLVQAYEDGYELGIAVLSMPVGRRRAVIRHARRFDHMWLCEEEGGRILRFDALGYGDAHRFLDEAGRERCVVAGRTATEELPGVTQVRARLGSGAAMCTRVRHGAWLFVVPEDVGERETLELSWHTASGALYRGDDAPATVSELLGDEGPAYYAPPHAP